MMETKIKPAAPLPWTRSGQFINARGILDLIAEVMHREGTHQDAAYIVHACNAYPRLVEVLRELHYRAVYAVGDCRDHSDRGAAKVAIDAASALLRELGET